MRKSHSPEEPVKRRREFLEAVLESLDEGIVACDADGTLALFNRATREFHGLPAEPLPPEQWADHYNLYLADGKTPMATADIPLFRALRGEHVRNQEMVIAPRNGKRRTLLATGQAIFDAGGNTLGAVVALRDITQQRETETRLEHHTLHDALTGLANRNLFADRVGRVLVGNRDQPYSAATLLIDIDHFKALNNVHGQRAGDVLLSAVARRLEAAMRPTDSVARVGDDEFAVLCDNVADEQGSIGIAERITRALHPPFDLDGQRVQITVSIGIALAGSADDDAEGLIRDAEAALQRAKDLGMARYEFFAEDMRVHVLERLEEEKALRLALEREEFHLEYQPEIALQSDRIMGVEALLRWERPGRGLVPPADFIPLAEETGLIVPIGTWVLERACRQAATWHSEHPDRPTLIVSVNVSGRQFHYGFAETIRGVLRRTGADARMLCLELTESTVMENVDATIKILLDLKNLGVKISIDDFGTGYSSLAYLKRFPLDMLKIDRSFVDGLGRDPEDTAIVAAVVGMAHALNLSVVGEGVETAEQLERLRGLGCEYAQGYYLARPMRSSAVDALLAAERETRQSSGAIMPSGYRRDAVVIADDAPEVRQLARMSLSAAGFEIHEAASGQEAIALARQIRPECVVLDVEMGDVSGFDVCRALRADPTTTECTVLMLTSQQQASAKVEAFSAGADDYVLKPFAPRDLVGRVQAAVRRRGPFASPLRADGTDDSL